MFQIDKFVYQMIWEKYNMLYYKRSVKIVMVVGILCWENGC